jgi:flagellar motor switch protein FliN/FliY
MISEQVTNHARPVAGVHTAQVISLGELHGDGAHRAEPLQVLQNTNPLHAIRTRLRVCVGEVELSVGELLDAKEHQVLQLDRAVDHPVDMLLEGKVVARGQLVAVDGCFAVRITELPLPLKA